MIRKLYCEKFNTDEVKSFIKKEYDFDLDEECTDVQQIKNKVFANMYSDAKELLSNGTVGSYRRKINKLGNNRKKALNSTILKLGNSIIRKKNELNNK